MPNNRKIKFKNENFFSNNNKNKTYKTNKIINLSRIKAQINGEIDKLCQQQQQKEMKEEFENVFKEIEYYLFKMKINDLSAFLIAVAPFILNSISPSEFKFNNQYFSERNISIMESPPILLLMLFFNSILQKKTTDLVSEFILSLAYKFNIIDNQLPPENINQLNNFLSGLEDKGKVESQLQKLLTELKTIAETLKSNYQKSSLGGFIQPPLTWLFSMSRSFSFFSKFTENSDLSSTLENAAVGAASIFSYCSTQIKRFQS